VPYNLNAMSHDAAIGMVRAVIDAGVTIDTCYVDTVGIADSYRSKLERTFSGHNITFVVETKADAKYAPCSAASVVAKESRDELISNWKYTEAFDNNDRSNDETDNVLSSKGYGSGYPSDPKCKSWLGKVRGCIDAPFGFPDLVRFSWNPAKKALAEDEERPPSKNDGGIGFGGGGGGPIIVRWEADEDDDDVQQQGEQGGKQQSRMDCFVVNKATSKGKEDATGKRNCNGIRTLEVSHVQKRARMGIFNEMGLSKVTKFIEVP